MFSFETIGAQLAPIVSNKNIDFNVDNINFNNIDLLRYDENKLRINKNNLNNFKSYIQDEFNNLIKNDRPSADHFDCIKDNLSYKVIFCYYRKIN